MKTLAILCAALCSLTLLAPADAQYRRYVHRPAQVPSYKAPVVHQAPVHHRVEAILFADVFFPIFDLHARDVFIFQGPLYAPLPTSSATPAPAPVQRVADSALLALAKEDQLRDTLPPLAGYESGAAPLTPLPDAPPATARLASLTAACASCHTAGDRVRGGFVLFSQPGVISPSVDWKAVRDAVLGPPVRMPPPSAGKPPVSEEDRREIARLAL